ncbi:S8 family serine peptidase [Flindersiella endophytica]
MLVAAAALLAAASTAGAAPPPADQGGPGPTARAATQAERHTVTLITGDRVTVTTTPGRLPAIQVRPGAGRDRIGFQERRTSTSVRVVPSDAGPLIASGRLDERLFDVTGLIRQGYDDARRADLPLIVTAGKRLEQTGGLSVVRRLPSVGAQAVRARKAVAGTFWTTVRTGGVSKVWLDGRVRASLDQSVPQIGAPDAWQAGFTGKGVTVAVLDTGVDATHPDLADAIVDAKDFTGSPSGTADKVGHGTHVASIVTGDGTASGGRYKGVAPDAKLLSGKVLSDDGYGSDSDIIAGMEWATAAGAKVVNLSLGAPDSPGTDPLEQAVDRLTEQTGALFVIAAGNEGPQRLGTPSTADAALAVGAVDKSDQFAGFSSTGPRPGDFAIKPDLTAPGVGIAAARAGGTSLGDPVDDHYTRLDGTSMATPHVAGAAAILLQQHPDWNAARLKPALMSSAKPNAELSPFEQGAGRVDLTRAISTTVYPDQGSVSLFNRWPQTGELSRTVSYHNDGTAPVTLNLTTSLEGATVEPAELTVPANGTAAATLRVDATATDVGDTTGALTATLAGGSAVARTALAVHTEAESYDVTVKVLDRTGKDISENTLPVQLLNLDTFEFTTAHLTGGELVMRVPKGTYELLTVVETAGADGVVESATVMTTPDLVVEGALALTLDARTAKRMTASAGAPKAVPAGDGVALVETFGEQVLTQGWSGQYGPGQQVPLYATPTKPVTSRPYEFGYHATLAEPATAAATATAEGARPPATYHLVFRQQGRIPDELAFRADPKDLAVVDTHLHAQGVPADAFRWDTPWLARGDLSAPLIEVIQEPRVPERRTEYYTAMPDLVWGLQVNLADTDGTGVNFEDPDLPADGAYRAGQAYRLDAGKAAFGPQMLYSNRDGATMGFLPEPIAPASSSFSGTFNRAGYTGQVTLTRDGTVIGSTEEIFQPEFVMPSGPATYTLRQLVDRSVAWSKLGTHTDTSWTFQGQGPAPESEAGPLGGPSEWFTTMAARITGDFDDLNRAPAARTFPLRGQVRWNVSDDVTPPQIKTITMAASYDDGHSWQALPVTHDGSTWRAIARHPALGAGTGFVSLRLTILDTENNRLDQTVIRSYQLR